MSKYMQCPLCNYVLYDLSHFLIHTRVMHHRIDNTIEEQKPEHLLMRLPMMMYQGPTKPY